MAEVLTENEDDIIDETDITIVDTPQSEVPVEAPEQPAAADEDDGDHDDERLGESEDGDDSLTDKQRKRREERRAKNEMRKQARLRTEAELQELRAVVPDLVRQVNELRAAHSTSAQTSLQAQIAQAEEDARIAGELHAQAIDTGNGRDALQALDIRDRARAKVAELRALVPQGEPSQPQGPNPEAARLYEQWSQQNAWFNAAGTDPASQLTRAIDRQVLAEGYNPASTAYWQELTRRVTVALDDAGMLGSQPKRQPSEPPPTGMKPQHAPASTKKGVHLSADRVQAIKDAGAWDDPVARTRMIKAYQDYDRANGLPNRG